MTSNRSIHDLWSKFKRSKTESSTSQSQSLSNETHIQSSTSQSQSLSNETHIQSQSQNINSQSQVEFNLEQELVADPGLRPSILEYDANKRDGIRREYLLKGPHQPMLSKFPQTVIYGEKRRFNPEWYKKYAGWLEYSEKKDAVFCLYCYLFKVDIGGQGGGNTFVGKGFNNWRKTEYLSDHVGESPNSIHRQCTRACQDLRNRKQHIDIKLANISDQEKKDYKLRLLSSIKCVRLLLNEGLPFRGHDESDASKRQGLFLSILKFLSENNDDVNKVVLNNAPGNQKLTAPSIQKDICSAAAFLTTKVIVAEIGDNFFSLLVDEARDSSIKEQMAIALRYVNKHGCIIECFLGIVHVSNTRAQTLKEAIESLFATHGLSMSRVRGQGYDGASNMRGEFNGLKSLILSENKSAFYVHCFAHQLQLTLVAVAKKHKNLKSFFDYLAILANVVGASCKRKDVLRVKHIERIIQGVASGEIKTGRGLNQEATLKRPGDTRWGSHYGTILSVINLFSETIEVLEIVEDDTSGDKSTEAGTLLHFMRDFEFVFLLHLMKKILGITNTLSLALQKKDQNLVNAMTLVTISKQQLQSMRDSGWETLLTETTQFCNVHGIVVHKMEDTFLVKGRSRRGEKVTNLHHFQVELLYTVIDSQLQELNDRFDNVNTELLSCMACLDPSNSFSAFDKERLIKFAKFYPLEFQDRDIWGIDDELETYILDVKNDSEFSNMKGMDELAQKLVKKNKTDLYPRVYLLLRLALTLPVATATVERIFSAMNIIKTTLRNQMSDKWLSDCLVPYIENDVFETIDNEAIVEHFLAMRRRRIAL